ncbi:MAG: DUF1684 domain-containing protein [Bacteroidota bacterium]
MMEATKKSNPIYFFGILVVVMAIVLYTFTDTEVKEAYTTEIQHFRLEKEAFFRDGQASPLEDRTQFKGLVYFDPTPEYRIQADLELINSHDSISIQMSNGKKEKLAKYAYAIFQLGGKTNKLLLLKHAEEEGLFLPFGDKTNGLDTYGGGRYLDLKPDNNNPEKIMIDFNLAYNPFCAYNKNYSCPLPPRENQLDVEIRAGEKEYPHAEKK